MNEPIKITPESIFKSFFEAQLKDGKMGLIPSFTGFNQILRDKMDVDPVAFTNSLRDAGLINISGKKAKNGTPYVVLTLTDKGYSHFGLNKPVKPAKQVANKQVDSIWKNIQEGKPVVILKKKASKPTT